MKPDANIEADIVAAYQRLIDCHKNRDVEGALEHELELTAAVVEGARPVVVEAARGDEPVVELALGPPAALA